MGREQRERKRKKVSSVRFGGIYGRESAKEEHIVLIGLLQKAFSLMGLV